MRGFGFEAAMMQPAVSFASRGLMTSRSRTKHTIIAVEGPKRGAAGRIALPAELATKGAGGCRTYEARVP
eukprot:2701865-Prymnesium_polylepis.1